jgi:transposase-like protein
MPAKVRRKFTDEFKAEAANLVRTSEKSIAQVARDLGVSQSTLHQWMQRSQAQGPSSEMSVTERQELVQLRKDNRVLRMERDLLKKWAAFFAKEQT